MYRFSIKILCLSLFISGIYSFSAHGGDCPPKPEGFPSGGIPAPDIPGHVILPFSSYPGQEYQLFAILDTGLYFKRYLSKAQVQQSIIGGVATGAIDRGCEPCFNTDSDGDSWSDCAEIQHGTDPKNGGNSPDTENPEGAPLNPDWNNYDSDGDGYSDYQEAEWGSDPTDPYDAPPGAGGGPLDLCSARNPATGVFEECPPPRYPPWFPYPPDDDPDPDLGDGGGSDGGSGGGDGGGGNGSGSSGDGGDGGGSGGGSSGGGSTGGGGGTGGTGGGGSTDGGGGGTGDNSGGGNGDDVGLSDILGKLGEIKDAIENNGGGGGGSTVVNVDMSGVEGKLNAIKKSIDEFGNDADDWPGYADWKKPDPTEGMASAITPQEVEPMLDSITQGMKNMGLSPSELDKYSAQSFSTSFQLPVGGSLSDLQWETYTFRLDDLSVSNLPVNLSSSILDIRKFVYTVLKAIISLFFLVRVWRLVWG